jgi:DNA repair ATPase RecN
MLRGKSTPISEPLMSDETEPTLPPDLDGASQDLTGAGIVALFRRSADLAEGNSRYALEVAQKLSRRLVASENRVAELERRLAELEEIVKVYRDRSEQAEGWLQKISSELQERVAKKPN